MALSRDSPTVPVTAMSSGADPPATGDPPEAAIRWTVRISPSGRYVATTGDGVAPALTVSGDDLSDLSRHIQDAVLRALL